MSHPKIDRRLNLFLRSLSVTEWRGYPKGVGLKTALIALDYDLIEARGEWRQRTHRLTSTGKAVRNRIASRHRKC